jgi:hypothetical protein
MGMLLLELIQILLCRDLTKFIKISGQTRENDANFIHFRRPDK